MMKYWALLTIVILLPLTALSDEDEEKDKKVYPSIETGIAIGGIYTDNTFTSRPLKTFHMVANFPFSDQVFYGIGTGYEQGRDFHLLPFYLTFKGMFDDEGDTPYISSRLGYSFAWADRNTLEDYKVPGGMLFSAGAGYRYRLSDRTSILVEVGYHHQFLTEKFHDYDQEINLDMIAIKVGILF
ncbi:MAG: hypothetical protein K9I68_00925 [Bacteroidales bacterium]|nr:hypothetical protein [Bacteroidales bacterium]MCF8336907.1 hypothetical protein [Bacteroidales bacterium]